MKTLPAILAVAIALVLVVSPMVVFAAGTVTFTSPTSGSTVPAGAYIIAGTVSPAQSGADQLFIKVTSPSGTIVDASSVSVTPNTGAFSYPTTAFSSWASGTYTISATDSYGATGSETFNFVGTPHQGVSGLALEAWATASTPINGGTSAAVEATVIWNNGTFAKGATFTGVVITPNGQAAAAGSPTAVSGAPGAYWWTIPTTASQNGMWVVMLSATDKSGTTSYGAFTQTSFTVSDIATGTAVAAIASSLTNLQSSLTSMGSTLTSIQNSLTSMGQTLTSVQQGVSSLPAMISAVGDKAGNLTTPINNIESGITGIQSSITSLGNSVTSATNAANSASTAASAAQTAANNAKDAINSTSTYVLVVVVIAAITLVLELAILVRKLS